MSNLKSKALVAMIFLSIAVGLGWGVRWLIRPGMSTARAIEAIQNNNLGVAHLENDEADKARPLFLELNRQLPNQSLGLRNLTVASLLQLEHQSRATSPQEFLQVLRQATKDLTQLQNAEPESATTYVLATRIASLADEKQQAWEAIQRASQLEPADPAIWYELYSTGRHSEIDAVQEQAVDGLVTAFHLAEHNLWVMLDLLTEQVNRRDPLIAGTIRQAVEVLQPLAAGILRRRRVDVLSLLKDALQAVETDQWADARRNLLQTANVVRPEDAAQSDRVRLERNALELVIADFPQAFYDQHGLDRGAAGSAIPVTFAVFGGPASLPQLANLQDATLADFDLDGRLDVITLQADRVSVWGRTGTDAAWGETVTWSLSEGYERMVGVDLDADFDVTPQPDGRPCRGADLDLILLGRSGISILENYAQNDAPGRALRAVNLTDGLEQLERVLAVSPVDFDHDGDLDLVVSSQDGLTLWQNRGQFLFHDVSGFSLLPPADFNVRQLIPLDLDRDMDLDILLVGEKSAGNGYLENLRHGELRWHPFPQQFPGLTAARYVEPIDALANASWDFLCGGSDGIALVTTNTVIPGTVSWVEENRVSEHSVDGQLVWDYDNDGFEDVLGWNANNVFLWRNLGHAHFESAHEVVVDITRPILACESGDLDDDGDLDLFVLSSDGIYLYENRGGNANGWLKVTLLAQQAQGDELSASGRVNSYGWGSLLELRSGNHYQSRVVRRQTTHFGVGPRKQADALRVLWTNGVPQSVIQPQTRQFICEKQQLKGSCPYLFGWDGEKHVFITDLCWSAPLGLQTAEGSLAPTRHWEYIKIPREMLKSSAGQYQLQITEELWEAAYFDQVQLLAVDHPDDVEVFTNEKVGPAEIAQFQIHTAKVMQRPKSARDSYGRDVLPLIAQQDDRYVKLFEQKFRQGYVEPHYLEIDLGRLQDPKQIMLFLTGWVYPTDTSLNVQLSQDPHVPGPRAPFLMTAGADGNWQEVRPYMGFPGGKTKTIAVDLSGCFVADDYRVRVCTSMEIYWDAVFFTVDEQPADFRLQTATLLAADLHYRGFSTSVPHPDYGPDRYDYQTVIDTPIWPAMRGRFTRYGNVTDLVRHADDRSAVLGSGDEMTLHFQLPEHHPLPGWSRDFLLHNIGWDKDADLNTVYGQTVEPLPFRGMTSYPYSHPEAFPSSPLHVEYLRMYQTRRMHAGAFTNQIRDARNQLQFSTPSRVH